MELPEAAGIDGATELQYLLWGLHSLDPGVIITVLSIIAITVLKVFDIVFVTDQWTISKQR